MEESWLVAAGLFLSCYLCLMSALFATVSACVEKANALQMTKSTLMTAVAVATGAAFYNLSKYAYGN